MEVCDVKWTKIYPVFPLNTISIINVSVVVKKKKVTHFQVALSVSGNISAEESQRSVVLITFTDFHALTLAAIWHAENYDKYDSGLVDSGRELKQS